MKHKATAIVAVIAAITLARPSLAQESGKGSRPNALLEAFDTNHDGTLSPAEVEAATAKLRELATKKEAKPSGDESQGRRGGRGGRDRGTARVEKSPQPERTARAQPREHEAHGKNEKADSRKRAVGEHREREPSGRASAGRSAGRRAGRRDIDKDRKSTKDGSRRHRGGRRGLGADGDAVNRRDERSASVHQGQRQGHPSSARTVSHPSTRHKRPDVRRAAPATKHRRPEREGARRAGR